MPHAVWARVGRADPFGLGARRPAPAAGLRLEVQWPELVETDDERLAGLGERVELDDAIALGDEVRVVGALPRPHRLKADAFLAQQLPEPFLGNVRDHPSATRN